MIYGFTFGIGNLIFQNYSIALLLIWMCRHWDLFSLEQKFIKIKLKKIILHAFALK